jgi:hypothetical protein
MTISVETLGVIFGIAATLGALIVWAIRASLAPMKELIVNNTDALGRIADTLEMHTNKLENHGERIAVIETKHRVRHGE